MHLSKCRPQRTPSWQNVYSRESYSLSWLCFPVGHFAFAWSDLSARRLGFIWLPSFYQFSKLGIEVERVALSASPHLSYLMQHELSVYNTTLLVCLHIMIDMCSFTPRYFCFSVSKKNYISLIFSFRLSFQKILDFCSSQEDNPLIDPISVPTMLLSMKRRLVRLGAVQLSLSGLCTAANWMIDPSSCDVGKQWPAKYL